MTAAVLAAFAGQARACDALGSALTAGLCRILPEALRHVGGPVADRVLGWRGDPSSAADSVPLRLCGALHALVLEGRAPRLAQAYAEGRAPRDVLIATVRDHPAVILTWLDSPPQTNEVGRAAPLIAAARFLRAQVPLPMDLLELGASAGLNLNLDRYHLGTGHLGTKTGVVLTPEWRGVMPQGEITVAARRGVDLNPLDPRRDGGRLMAYCWADQSARLDLLRAALSIAQKAPPPVDAGDAGTWLSDQLARPAPGRLRMVFHTIAAQYFPPATKAACTAALDAAGAVATPTAALAHVAMEADGGHGAALTATLWDGTRRDWSLGRADFHGRWVEWQPRKM